jgi:hypothetical protein
MKRILAAALLALLPLTAGATITYIGAGATDNDTNDNAITPTAHASTTSGDLILFVWHRGHDAADGGALTAGTAVTGYTNIEFLQNAATTGELSVYCRIATGSDAISAVPPDGTDATGDMHIGQTLTFRGTLNTCTGIVAHTNETTNTAQNGTLTNPALTITTDNTLLAVFGSKKGVAWSTGIDVLTTDSFGWAEVIDFSTLSGEDGSLGADYVIQTTAANLSAGSFTVVGDVAGTTQSIALSIKSSPPAFTTGPAAGDPDITSIPTTFTTDINAAPVEGVACIDGSGPPSATQIKNDQCSGGGGANAHFDENTVGGVADGATFTGLTGSTTYDLHFVAVNGSGDSAVASVNNIATDAAGSVNISDVDTDEIVTATQLNVVITGTTFGATQGVGSVTLRQNGNSKTLSVDSWSATSIQVDMSGAGMGVVSGLKYGATDIRVTTNAGPSDDQAITVNPPSGTEYVELSTPTSLTFDIYGNESRFHGGTSGTDPTVASQCAWRNVSGPSSVDVNTDASVTVTGTGTFDVDCTDNSGSGGSELYVASYSAHPNCASGSTIVCSLAVQGTPPLFAATPITDHVLALTQAMTSYDVDNYFVAGDSAASARSLRQLGTVTDTTADLSGAHTNVSEILVTNAVAHASLVKGAWLRIGAGGAPTRIKYVDPVNNLIGLWSLASGSNLDAINTYANNAGSVSGITVDSGTGVVSGMPTVDATTGILLYRWTDAAGLITESTPKFQIDAVTIPDVTTGNRAGAIATLQALGLGINLTNKCTTAEAIDQVLTQTPSSALWTTSVLLEIVKCGVRPSLRSTIRTRNRPPSGPRIY